MPTGRDWRCLHPRARDRDDAATPHQPYVVFIAAGPSNTICDLHPWRRDIGVQQWAALLGVRLSGGGGCGGGWMGCSSELVRLLFLPFIYCVECVFSGNSTIK